MKENLHFVTSPERDEKSSMSKNFFLLATFQKYFNFFQFNNEIKVDGMAAFMPIFYFFSFTEVEI